MTQYQEPAMMSQRIRFPLVLLLCFLTKEAVSIDELPGQALPVPNPYLANNTYATVHGGSGYGCFSSTPGPEDVKRPLVGGEVVWRPTELASWSINYSGAYPNGRRVAWTGGGKVLFKFDADTLKLLDSVAVRGGSYMSPEEVAAYVGRLDSLSGKQYYQLAVDKLMPEMGGAASFYKLVSNDNELYLLVNDVANNAAWLRVYGDKVKNDPDSGTVLLREWQLPKVADAAPLGLSLNMSYDGRVIVTTRDGTLFSVARDFGDFDYLVLPGGGQKSKGMSDSFIRNAPPIDPDGGIYVVTHDLMFRAQWTGQRLSLDPADGAWSAPYPGGRVGSGTTPSLMGWTENEDQLVIIGDGRPQGKMHIWAFWRGQIPVDWQGLEGHPKRVAGKALVDYGKYTPETATVENNLTVKGYGVYVTNDSSVAEITSDHYDGSPEGRWLASYAAVAKDEAFVSRGGLKYQWNPDTRKFELKWSTDRSFTTTVPVVDVNNTLFGIGWRDGAFTMEAVDWYTGDSKYWYELGAGVRYNIFGGSLSIAPNGALDCPCQGGVGVVRIQPGMH
jgi:hypothetical protein